MHGDTAILTGAYHERGDNKGKAYDYRDRFTDVWMKTGGSGGWWRRTMGCRRSDLGG
jgi:ketosteroid isomerase-like protein